jgi:hypothetical protein
MMRVLFRHIAIAVLSSSKAGQNFANRRQTLASIRFTNQRSSTR